MFIFYSLWFNPSQFGTLCLYSIITKKNNIIISTYTNKYKIINGSFHYDNEKIVCRINLYKIARTEIELMSLWSWNCMSKGSEKFQIKWYGQLWNNLFYIVWLILFGIKYKHNNFSLLTNDLNYTNELLIIFVFGKYTSRLRHIIEKLKTN